jgi:hypothetical protein
LGWTLHATSDPETCGAKVKPVIEANGVRVHDYIVARRPEKARTIKRFFANGYFGWILTGKADRIGRRFLEHSS